MRDELILLSLLKRGPSGEGTRFQAGVRVGRR